eukprot:CAMPEP_0181256620 /NCGR_PEP_ID=MMETSP1096-20121128/49810_1 /TAXON_ID=156174 ORGANISM="Chrysochromulina ericina, Strain CCMP281" /NCGR_SAMPLE_ID=MMETSP1096 /ASSEMBLY_ACC=CAM_ASM_000453 /LENGTH=68 /DNA_ID=CAMNT_0023354887 /DNA_START=27 /DNA_END=233 /DNA_ORIENTATION=+
MALSFGRPGQLAQGQRCSATSTRALRCTGLGDHRFRVPRRRAAVRGGWQRMEERRQSKRHTGGARDKK